MDGLVSEGDLVFSRAPSTNGELVFGDDDDLPAGHSLVSATIVLKRPGFRARIALGVTLGMRVQLKRPALQSTVRYVSGAARPIVGQLGVRQQAAQQLETGLHGRLQDARSAVTGATARHAEALPLGTALGVRVQDAVRLRRESAARLQDAWGLASEFTARVQDAWRVRQGVAGRYQNARPLGTDAVWLRTQDAIGLRGGGLVRFQDALGFIAGYGARSGPARPVEVGFEARFQDAISPSPGISVRPPQPPAGKPCYVPNAQLLFDAGSAVDGALVFVCECTTDPVPDPAFVIPLLRVYMTTHYLEAVLLPSMERVPLLDVTLTADADNPTWGLSASGPVSLFDQLGGGSAPKQIQITIDGVAWVFTIERLGRTRNPGLRRVQVSARSSTSLLGSPYMPAQTWLSMADMTAQQVVAQALEFTGINLDWQIPDWIVPAGAWSFTGTPLAAALRVAEAAGAVLQSHATAPTLRFLPRYPLMPWEWPSAGADVSMPSAAITTDSLDRADAPAWEAVYVMGTTQGVMTRVKRSGTAGALLAPQVADDLITDVVAARQRGRSILGTGGNQAEISMSMPLLQNGSTPSLLAINQLLEVVEPAETWRGLVRGVSLQANPGAGSLRQTVRVERHL